jgi:hypothetical protein
VTADDLPLPTLLSRLLIAFTIEFDNETEHRLEHRTTRGAAGGGSRGPWLVSQAMWANFMQFVGGDGVPLRDVDDLAGITNLAGLQRWGYIRVGPDPADGRPAPPRRDWIVRPTRAWCCTVAGGPTAAERPMPVSPPGWAAPCRRGKMEP